MPSGGRRFHGKAGRDYALFLRARPHYAEMQELLGKNLREFAARSRSETIDVVELGCGQGQTTMRILAADRRIRLVAVDDEPVMLREARKNLDAGIRSGRVRLVRSDALAFLRRQGTSSFDAVASAFMLHNLTRSIRASLLKECFRVLRPGGLLLNADKYAQDDRPRHRRALAWQLSKFALFDKIGRPDLRRAWTRHYMDDERPVRVMRASASAAALRGLGFSSVRLVHRRHLEALLLATKSRKQLKSSRDK